MNYDVYVLDTNLALVGVIDNYTSMIWANRYNDVGDCELYLPATPENFTILQKNYYLYRTDDEMVCQIKKIELTTDVDLGDNLIITGKDVKSWLDQRVIWNMVKCNGNPDAYIKSIVSGALGSAADADRQILINGSLGFNVANAVDYGDTLEEQASYKNVGEKVRDICVRFGYGYRVVKNGSSFTFETYEGTDRSSYVVFSEDYENLSTTNYTEDETMMGNVALVAGEGEGSARSRSEVGTETGVGRYEIYVDAKDISRTITGADLLDLFPDLHCVIDGDLCKFVITVSGEEIIVGYGDPELGEHLPEDTENITLSDYVYIPYLTSRGFEAISEYGAVTSFEGSVEPSTTFKFKEDYFLGDIVKVKSKYGITVNARIVEVVEVNDENGYYVEPKFEYLGG